MKFSVKIITIIILTINFTACDFSGSDNGSDDDKNSNPVIYSIGDTGPGGGIVFYITDGGIHGLEVTARDLNSGKPWIYDRTAADSLNGNTDKAIGKGMANTNAIIAQSEAGGNYKEYRRKPFRRRV